MRQFLWRLSVGLTLLKVIAAQVQQCTGMDFSYSYTPDELLASHKRLKVELPEKQLPVVNGVDVVPGRRVGVGMVVAATQITGAGLNASDVYGYCDRAEQAIALAVQDGANLVLLPELWSGPYFCQSQVEGLMQLASPMESNILIERMQQIAKMYGVVLPVSFYERRNNALYNSLVMIDADGTNLGVYRKTHIPDGTGYQEKFYFTPGDSGFRVFDTAVGRVGVAICWDQWFPETARALALQGADVLLFPTAIGSEPQDPTINSADHWQRVMQGHAAANMVPVVASNRFGTEILLEDDGREEKQRIHFYGRSFITDHSGQITVECADNTLDQPVVVATSHIDTEANLRARTAWGLFRDRRPEQYRILLTKDGA